MKAVRIHELVGPSGLRVDDVPDPSVADRHVVIDVRAAGVNFPDVLQTYGKYQFKPTPPFSPGGEVAGVVSAIGSGVTTVAVGDRVAATMLHGAYAEKVVVPEQVVVPLPANVSFEIGAATLLTYATTIHALQDRAKLQAGETLLVLGAAGGVGIAAVELGVLMGARVIAAASTADKLAFCKSHGAHEAIDYSTEDLKERVKALAPAGVDVIYDPVGGSLAEPALRSIGWQGRYLVVGFAAGEIPKIPLNLALLMERAILGVFWGAAVRRDLPGHLANMKQLAQWFAEGKVKPVVSERVALADASAAIQRLAGRQAMGKLVVLPEAVAT